MARQPATVKATTKRKTNTTRGLRQSTQRKKASGWQVSTFFVPLIFIVCLAFCVFYLLFLGYTEVAKSSFFDLEDSKIDIRGIEPSSAEEIREIVKRKTTDGVLNANLSEIQTEVEKLESVKAKSTTVSRVLPDGLRIRVEEKLR
jgi:cell division septal protein FtsQ